MKLNDSIIWDDMKYIYNNISNVNILKNKSVLVTGASGMLASYIIYFLSYLNIEKQFNIKIYALVRNKKKALERFKGIDNKDFFVYINQDVCDYFSVSQKVNYIVHAAGNASPRHIINDPVGIIRANTIGTMRVLEYAQNSGVEKILYTSTREIYGKVENKEYITENDMGINYIDEIRACYPESKRVAETILKSYYYQYKIPYVTARIVHVYGPGMPIENDGRIMSDLIGDVVNNKNIILKSDGTADRAFCYIADAIVGLMILLINGKNSESYNLSNESEPYKISEVAQMLIDLFPEKKLSVIYDISDKTGQGYSKIGRIKLNTDKLQALGWCPHISLREGLKRTVDSFEVK